jgi:phosphoglycolate phosphatase
MAIQSLDLLLFDLDGTLVDSQEDIADCVNSTLKRFNKNPIAVDVVAQYVGTGIQPLLRQIFEPDGAEAVQKAFAAFNACYSLRLTDHTKVYPDTFEVLEHYRHIRKVILTNKMQKFADVIVDNLKLRGHFDAVFGREAFATRKPDPGPVIEICAKYNVNPARAAMVGDTEFDLRAGRDAGVLTVAALFGYGLPQQLKTLRPDYLIQSAKELIGLFE